MKTILSEMPRIDNYRQGHRILDIGYPWLTPGAIVALEEVLQKGFKVIEFGCGGSTIFFANRCQYVKSFDLSQKWIDRVKNHLTDSHNVELIFAEKMAVLGLVQKEPDDYYDVSLIDIGVSPRLRLALAGCVLPKIRTGGFLVVDNYQNRYINRINYDGLDVYTFDDLKWSGRGTRICVKK